jgi:hypothetical protein
MTPAESQSNAPNRLRLPWWLAPLALAAVLAAGIAAVILLAQRAGQSNAPPEADPFVFSGPARPATPLDVQLVEGEKFTLSRSQAQGQQRQNIELQLPAATPVELLEPAVPGDIAPGDWITVIGIRNIVKSFSIHLIVVLPGTLALEDGIVRTNLGYFGHEAARDPNDRPILSGKVIRMDGATAVLDTPGGETTLEFLADAPLRKLRTGTAADIGEGDRVAVVTDAAGALQPATGLLDLVGGAQ